MADRGFANINELEVGARVREFAEGMNGAWNQRSQGVAVEQNILRHAGRFLRVLNAVCAYMLRSRMGGALLPGAQSIFFPANFPITPYLGFLLLYMTVIVLFCHSQNLYRTVPGCPSLDEVIAVAKAVLLATLLLTAFIYLSGMNTVSRLGDRV